MELKGVGNLFLVHYVNERPPAGSPMDYFRLLLRAFFVELEGVEPSSNGETGDLILVRHSERAPFIDFVDVFSPRQREFTHSVRLAYRNHFAWRPSGTALTLRVRSNTLKAAY